MFVATLANAQEPSLEELDEQALALYRQGKYAEAVQIAEKALRIAEESSEPEQLSLATALNSLGRLYETLGRYAEAEPLFIRALGICIWSSVL